MVTEQDNVLGPLLCAKSKIVGVNGKPESSFFMAAYILFFLSDKKLFFSDFPIDNALKLCYNMKNYPLQ